MAVTEEQVWQWLTEVPDPEVPVISIVDLGIVRNVAIGDAENCIITITPTYSGCPAVLVISEAIAATLKQHGVTRFRLETQLSPAWTTEWMSESGRKKLKEYGIAPPLRMLVEHQVVSISGLRSGKTREADVQCPHCSSMRTRLISRFGSTSCKALYVCGECREPFDYFKSH